ncbi:MAG: acyltransferase [Clostridiaceae bacterium]|nr:acyltransferase [Clostridiaceae bacterium]
MVLRGGKSNHIKGLDGLRGIAVIGVVLYHIYSNTIKGGFLGVALFFVLSGYLIAVTSERDWSKHKFTFLNFYKKRIKRILPPLLIVILTSVCLLMIISPNGIGGIRKELYSILFGYNNWWQIMNNESYFTKISNNTPFTHLWSLSIELQYYLIWPVLFLLHKNIKKKYSKKLSSYVFIIPAVISFLLMAFLYNTAEDPSRIYYGTDTRIFSLLIGAILGTVIIKNKRNKVMKFNCKKVYRILFNISIFSLGVFFIFMNGESQFTYRGGILLASVAGAIIVKIVSNPKVTVGQFLDFKPLSYLGKISYEIYLWQYPVIYVFNFMNWNNSLVQAVLQVMIILGLSMWLHKFTSLLTDNSKKKNKKRVYRRQDIYEEVAR